MNTCKRCGRSYQPEDKFCGFCGFNLAAQETSEMATRLALKSSEIHYSLGLRYFKEGKYAEAIAAFEKVLSENPEDAQVHEMLERARAAANLPENSSAIDR